MSPSPPTRLKETAAVVGFGSSQWKAKRPTFLYSCTSTSHLGIFILLGSIQM
ncbi:Hypothetical protein FKW44_001145 [Caligus rogercresseyi]|uniref:Uncharacterized protein n=1 Tax=Caligus rogercresseyi TaxID=217165 RepID=A0A7T8KIC5_CALRO|nr:Hypothetical protein FKW44_001133 [Caligus rogercresseyi]QQP56469.1 Hypothetical protein FKW44_001145 [Caligus rogercresseyi]